MRRTSPLRKSIRLIAVFATVWTASAAQTAGAEDLPALGCVARDLIGCGCALRLVGQSCVQDPVSSTCQLFSGESDGAPLSLVLDGRSISLASKRPASQSFSFSAGDRWTEEYAGEGVAVSIHYRPGRDTCPKTPPDTCEYLDVEATVEVRRDRRAPARYDAEGVCGC